MRSAPALTLAPLLPSPAPSPRRRRHAEAAIQRPQVGFAVTPFATGFVAQSFSASALVGARLRVAPRRGAEAAPLRAEAIPTTTETACNQRSGGF